MPYPPPHLALLFKLMLGAVVMSVATIAFCCLYVIALIIELANE